MIRYSLRCDSDHDFESWFQSAGAFDSLKAAGHICCAVCGSTVVEKALMAPAVSETRTEPGADEAKPVLSRPDTEIEKAISALRKKVEENADYVGRDFVREARAMHDGEAPNRSIWGEARPDEAKALMEDGVPVAPLPFLPSRKAN